MYFKKNVWRIHFQIRSTDSYGNFAFECKKCSEEYAFVISYVCLTHVYLMSWKFKPTFRHCHISFPPVAVLPIPNGTREIVAKSRLYQFVGGRVFGVWKLGWRRINISDKSNKVIEGAICRCFHSVKYAADNAIDWKWVLLKATSQRRQNFCLKALEH